MNGPNSKLVPSGSEVPLCDITAELRPVTRIVVRNPLRSMQFSIPAFGAIGTEIVRYFILDSRLGYPMSTWNSMTDWDQPKTRWQFSIPSFGTFGIRTEVLNIVLDYDDSVNHMDIKLMMIQ